MVRLNSVGSKQVHTVVAYLVEPIYEEGEICGVERLWVAARGYEGGGIIGSHSAVVSYDEEGEVISVARSYSAYPDMGDFEDDPEDLSVSGDDISRQRELWKKIDELTFFEVEPSDDPDSQYRFDCCLPKPLKDDVIMSDNWEADDLLEPVSDKWQLSLKF